MNTREIEDKMIAYLEGELNPSAEKELLVTINKNEELQNLFSEYKIMYSDLDEVCADIPSENVGQRFQDWLKEEINTSNTIPLARPKTKTVQFVNWRKMAGVAAIFCCVFGFWKVYDQNQQMRNSLANLEIMMNTQSSTERIKAIRVNYNHQEENNVNQKMIHVLINTLLNDNSSNVRLAAAETLSHYLEDAEVRAGMISALGAESDAGVKLAIINSLGQQKGNDIKQSLEKIVNDDSQEKFVIDEAHMQLIRFEKVDI